MPKDNPLIRYARTAKSQVMREIAAIALLRGLNQQNLAKLLGYTPPAVIKHFKAIRPSWPVVESYARKLSVPTEYLGLLCTLPRPLTTERRRYWWNFLKTRLDLCERRLRQFQLGTTRDIIKAFTKMPSDERLRALEAYVVGECRHRHLFTKPQLPEYEDTGIEAFADVMAGHFDLHARLRKERPGETFLWFLWSGACDKLTISNADVLVAVAKTLLERERVVDTAEIDYMIEYLESNETYRKYHDRSKPK